MAVKIATIGSREVKPEHESLLKKVGAYIAHCNVCIATGNATGSDQLFAIGANKVNPKKVVLYLPWKTYEASAINKDNHLVLASGIDKEIAEKCHPAWEKLSDGVKRMMVRNVGIIKNSKLVIAYLNSNKPGGGGTGHSLRVAKELGVPSFNLKEMEFSQVKKIIDDVLGLDE